MNKCILVLFFGFLSWNSNAQEIEALLDSALFSFEQLSEDKSKQEQLKEANQDKKVFFIAEAHELDINPIYQLFFFKYLYKYAGVRHLLTEYSYGTTLMIDRYVQSGDIEYLEATQDYKNELYRDYWRDIYDWNNSLPEADKISIHGIGRFNWPIVAPLYFCLPDDPPPNIIRKESETIRQQYLKGKTPSYYDSDFGSKKNMKLRRSLRKKLKKYPELESYFRENYVHVLRMANNLAAYNPIDQSMYENFSELSNDLKGNIMIVFGSYHCFLDRWEHRYDPIAKLINESENFENQIYATIGYFDNCKSSRGSLMDDGLKPFKNPSHNDLLLSLASERSDFCILNMDLIPEELLLDNFKYANLLFIMNNQLGTH